MEDAKPAACWRCQGCLWDMDVNTCTCIPLSFTLLHPPPFRSCLAGLQPRLLLGRPGQPRSFPLRSLANWGDGVPSSPLVSSSANCSPLSGKTFWPRPGSNRRERGRRMSQAWKLWAADSLQVLTSLQNLHTLTHHLSLKDRAFTQSIRGQSA